jgi:hypothetical protein
MYDYILVFLSTMFVTAFITRSMYQEHMALKAPVNIPTLSREKHDERLKLLEQRNKKRINVMEEERQERRFPKREYIYSPSILPHERTPTHLTKSIHEWQTFEQLHSDAPIGTWIHYDDPKVQGETTIRVTYAILRIDAPERWEEHVYFYHVGESIR